MSQEISSEIIQESIDWLTVIDWLESESESESESKSESESESIERYRAGMLELSLGQCTKPSAVWCAAAGKKRDYLGLILFRGAFPACDLHFGMTPLLACVKFNGCTRISDTLVAHGADVNGFLVVSTDKHCQQSNCLTIESSMNSVGLAALCGRLDMVNWLLQHGADARHISRSGHSTLHLLSRCETTVDERTLATIARILHAHGARPSLLEQRTNLPSEIAELRNRPTLTSVLSELGC